MPGAPTNRLKVAADIGDGYKAVLVAVAEVVPAVPEVARTDHPKKEKVAKEAASRGECELSGWSLQRNGDLPRLSKPRIDRGAGGDIFSLPLLSVSCWSHGGVSHALKLLRRIKAELTNDVKWLSRVVVAS